MSLRSNAPSAALVISCIALLVALAPAVRAAATVNTADIVNLAVTTPKLADEAVTSAKLGPGSVTSAKLAANSVAPAAIRSKSIRLAKMNGGDVKIQLTLAAGAIPNGRCKGQNFSVPGASAGDVVLISLQGAIPLQEGVFVYGTQVVSDGHVLALICNMSGTTLDAINKQVRVVTLG